MVVPFEHIAPPFHGSDGFGDTGMTKNIRPLQKEHGAVALCRMAAECISEDGVPGLSVLVLGPLSTLSLALRLDPTLGTKLARVVWMGSCLHAKGNSSLTAEFNAHADPEAAHVVLTTLPKGRLTVVPWEVTVDCELSWTWYDSWVAQDKPILKLIRTITEKPFAELRASGMGQYIVCDAVAAAVALAPQLTTSVERGMVVELHGQHTRGMTALDWYGAGRGSTVTVVEKVDTEGFRLWLEEKVAKAANE
eukprot:CAMPEP_0175906248 /NCGR_PEP_ID=MMETSP0108-20121206/5445_1 /TAXON_ID=195067 ORGANISM="Goniomonas pacifica, Strain CCMP1869" /NCGR_SAMPLE_ID=MMETSP0108 /ASSEMBLY_ACC=CAM_ASM_000204 /LENGTH=249 /DNA_ID=CAMNT_0017228187 /DNA_START=127 /DNA_END=876 /DNA_ORIENTATION=+